MKKTRPTLRKIKIIILCLIAAFLLWLLWSLFSHQMPWQRNRQTTKQLKVMTYNTQAMGIEQNNEQRQQMLQYINDLDADVVCMQEVLVYKNEKLLTLAKLRAAMSNYPYTYYDFKLYNSKRQFGNVVFSRYPLINKQTIRFKSKANISSQCDILAFGDTIRLIVNHLESFHFNKEDLNLEEITNSFQESRFGRKLIQANHLRRKQVTALCQAIRQSPHPVIVVGDFNSLPISLVYWQMNMGLRDCFAESSFGRYGSTYRRGFMRARIDYIFHSRKLKAIECKIGEENYSDHYPLIGTIGWD